MDPRALTINSQHVFYFTCLNVSINDILTKTVNFVTYSQSRHRPPPNLRDWEGLTGVKGAHVVMKVPIQV